MMMHYLLRRPNIHQYILRQCQCRVIVLLILLLVAKVTSQQLSKDELVQVFGSFQTVPNYEIFNPEIVSISARLGKRSVDADTSYLSFTALGRSYNFRLSRVSDLVSPKFAFVRRGANSSHILPWDKRRLDCLYRGYEGGSPATTIAIELCDRMRGVINGPDEELVIEPLPDGLRARRDAESKISKHLIYRRRSKEECSLKGEKVKNRVFEREFLFSRESIGNPRYFDPHEHVLDQNLRYNTRFLDSEEEAFVLNPDLKQDLYVEMAVFVDRDLFHHMATNFPEDTEDQVIKVVLAMINAVQLLYLDESLGLRLKFILNRLEILYDDPPDLKRTNNIDDFLTNFCDWQRQQNPISDISPLHWDHAVLLTGLDVFTVINKKEINSQVVGLAPVAGMCTRTSSCTVNEGRHFESVYVVAHEIGHNLGMRHDGLQAGNNCDPGRYLMSPTLGSGKITWSSCSAQYLQKFLESSQAECLMDPAVPTTAELDHESGGLPGQRFTADEQCMLKHGVGSVHAMSQPLEEICQDLHCKMNHYTWTSHPALEGTTCGNNMWCRRGKCIEDENAPSSENASEGLAKHSSYYFVPSAVKGEWGPWTECRSSCLFGTDGFLSSGSTGLSISERQCRRCWGEYRYRVCSAVHQCSKVPRKTLQDFSDEICRSLMREEPSFTGFSKRIYSAGLSQCDVECETYDGSIKTTRRSFHDGSVCISISKYPAFCVSGVCTEFRCEPDTLYGADPLTCRPDIGSPDPYRPLGPTPVPTFEASSLASSPVALPNNSWSEWMSASSCRYSCMSNARGIRLVTRECNGGDKCAGMDRNIQICIPEEKTCIRKLSPFEFATEVCFRYKSEVDRLSGLGMQLQSIKEDPDRGCVVACQDVTLAFRFYKVNGKDGWFPFGTNCSLSKEQEAYCLNGKCVLTGNIKPRTLVFDIDYRDAIDLRANHGFLHERSRLIRFPRGAVSTSRRIPGSIDEGYLLHLVDYFNNTIVKQGYKPSLKLTSLDFRNPLFVSEQTLLNQHRLGTKKTDIISMDKGRSYLSESYAKEDGAYKWKVVTSPCSVTCGEGTHEVIVLCASSKENSKSVDKSFCGVRLPILPGYQPCFASRKCLAMHSNGAINHSAVKNWLWRILNTVKPS